LDELENIPVDRWCLTSTRCESNDVLARIKFITNTPRCVTLVSHTSSHSSVTVADNTGHPHNCELSIQWAI